ncbi:MFS transporter [Nonomuraea glycinis]|uniref:MFS transporter n=1 Tax=Nonomuraea glycinis TaxID=2047744 RepID=A0A918E913_9ACTN|nr:MFS transporter [Nonomuraea glycinis]MCA2178286.1 MFS transporter [Nonomuraea glycinis]GGP12573.1 MFS transporter [Nonomuraea glycinis]
MRTRTNLTLATLFFGVFVMGCAELLVVGVLDLIAADLRVSIAAAGTLVTAYALGMAIGGPILTALTIRMDKRAVLVGTLVVFAVANLVPLLVPDHGVFVAARVLAGAVQGLFIAVGFVTGMALVPPERAGRAISVIISGIAVSAALGVPLGTLVGQTVGWRGSFLGIILLSVVALVATVASVPSVPRTGGGVAGQARYAFAPRVLAVLLVNVLVFAAVYSALTYIVPFLNGVTGISGALISVFLLAYGLANAVGAFCGGRFADRSAARTLVVATAGAAACLLALYLAGAVAPLVALVMAAWGLFVGGMVPSLQFRVVSLAGPGGALASSLPGSAINVGIAAGSLAGGVAIGGSGVSAPVVTGLIIAVIAVPTAWATGFLKPPTARAAELTPYVA